MFGHTFDHDTIRKYVILFGTLFNEVYIRRRDNNGNDQQTLKIPITYAPRDKILTRLDVDPNLERDVAITLPRMSFEMTSFNYDSERKLNTVRKNVKATGSDNNYKTVYNPVPYNFNFSLYVYVKNAEDGTRILEQILPFFTPEWTSTVNILPEMDLKYDIPIVMQSTSIEDIYEGDFESRRAMIYTLDFIVKGYIFGPVSQSGIIEIANTNFFVDEATSTIGTSNSNVESVSLSQANVSANVVTTINTVDPTE